MGWERKQEFGKFTCKFNVQQFLSSFTEHNPGHYVRIRMMAEGAGYNVSRLLLQICMENRKGKFACLQPHQSYNVIMSECFSPALFFVCKESSNDKKKYIGEELSKYIASVATQTPCKLNLGDFVIIQMEGDVSPERARIVEDVSSDNVTVFLVDLGLIDQINCKNVWKMPEKYITASEFLAIPCALQLKPDLLDEWSDKSGDVLFNLSRGSLKSPDLAAFTISSILTDVPAIISCQAKDYNMDCKDKNKYVPQCIRQIIPAPKFVLLSKDGVDFSEQLIAEGFGEAMTSSNEIIKTTHNIDDTTPCNGNAVKDERLAADFIGSYPEEGFSSDDEVEDDDTYCRGTVLDYTMK